MKKASPVAAKPNGAELQDSRQDAKSAPKSATRSMVTTQGNQSESFDSAMKLFHSRDFAGARKLFENAANGPNREMAHAARLHLRMCEQRLNQAKPEVRTPDELYHYAVSLINRRQLGEAESALRRALEQLPSADYVHYALALAHGLQGRLDEAAKHMARAIQLEPKNRVIARNDPDFMEFGRQSPVREVVFSENKESN